MTWPLCKMWGGEEVAPLSDEEKGRMDKFNQQIERYQAVCTLMGISPEMMDLDDLHDITMANSLPVHQLVSMVGSRRKSSEMAPSDLIDEELSDMTT